MEQSEKKIRQWIKKILFFSLVLSFEKIYKTLRNLRRIDKK
ncbi:hypothetical protein HMPREF1987_02319 [Peptostreptococcaceae bacterium oral taxon 113 str. W5053]|nr:hypothetical protein HMPREF1987_02319 [Peptostreptococcaceae bacterium oral taxon 113 str. W5053]